MMKRKGGLRQMGEEVIFFSARFLWREKKGAASEVQIEISYFGVAL